MIDLPPKVVVFTALDGTLLDHATYSYSPTVLVPGLLPRKQIIIVFSSAEASAEATVSG